MQRCDDRIRALEAQRTDIDAVITELQQFVASLGDADQKDR